MNENKVITMLEQARKASRSLNLFDNDKINAVLLQLADALVAATPAIVEANAKDLAAMDEANPMRDRLMLDAARIADIAQGVRDVAALPSPLHRTLAEWTRPNGMTIKKVSVPMGVIGVIYEARPNVTVDVFSLCLKSGSAVVMKGGRDAWNSNVSIVDVIHSVLREQGVDLGVATLMPVDHESTGVLLGAVGLVDLIIPRGGRGLIDFVRNNARVPVIETGAGLCHAYVHSSGDTKIARDIILNAKTRRVSVCNALDCVLVDASRVGDLPEIVAPLAQKGVEIHADEAAMSALEGKYDKLVPAEAADYDTEWKDYKMALHVVSGIDEALEHIALHGSGHSESIVATDVEAIKRFEREVDASSVYANLPTSFTDGGQFGFGAEIGISTQKLHARGPMGLPEITTYKYIVEGNGQTRP